MSQNNIIGNLIYSNEVPIAPGLTQSNYAFYDVNGRKIESTILYANLKCPAIHIDAGLPDDGDVWGMQKTTEMARMASKEGHVVVGAVNADFYNMTNGKPEGIFIKDGKILKDTMETGKNFFGIMKNNTAVIGRWKLFNEIKEDLQTALGSGCWMVKDGELNIDEIDSEVAHDPQNPNPRTGVGIKTDGTVFFVVVDGRQPGFSEGFTLLDFARFMLELGAMDALNLDGGGSSTLGVRLPGTDEFEMINSPSDGDERPTANAALIVSTAKMDHKFVCAYIEPFEIAAAPGCHINFTVKGRDAAGASAPIPVSGLSWSLSDTSYGAIDNNGHFISNGKEGRVVINIKYCGLIVGSTGLTIVEPDQLLFGIGTECMISKNVNKDLKLFGKYKGRNIKVDYNLVEWAIPGEIGFMDCNGVLCTGSQEEQGLVKAVWKGSDITASIDIKVGLLPIVLYDFEETIKSNLWHVGTIGNGVKASLDYAHYPAEPVWLGESSLRICFDFRLAEEDTVSGIFAWPSVEAEVTIPDVPKALGMWIYTTEEAQGLHLMCKLYDNENSVMELSFNPECKGIDWIGWRYVEAEIPVGFKAPFRFCPGQAIGIFDSSNVRSAGLIYIDNIRAVYVENHDDLTPPFVGKINVEGKVLDTSDVHIVAWIKKEKGYKYATGINYNRIRIFVDDKEYTNIKGHYGINKGNDTVMLSGLSLSDGEHKVRVWFKDHFGNEACREASFVVDTKGLLR